MYLHKTKNGHYTPPCCYFSGELEVVECLPQTFSGGMMVCLGILCVKWTGFKVRFFFHVMPPCGITCCLLEGKYQHLQHNFVKLLDKEQLFLYTKNKGSGTPVPIIQ